MTVGVSPFALLGPTALFALVLIVAKAVYLGAPDEATLETLGTWALRLFAISHRDVLFALTAGSVAALLLRLAAPRPRVARALLLGTIGLFALGTILAAANLRVFAYLRSPLTLPIIYLAHGFENIQSSIGAFLTPAVLLGLFGTPLLYAALAYRLALAPPPSTRAHAMWLVTLGATGLSALLAGPGVYERRWRERPDRRMAESPHATLLHSLVVEPLVPRATIALETPPAPAEIRHLLPEGGRAPAGTTGTAASLVRRPFRNVILLVLESVSARYLDCYGAPFAATPHLARAARERGLVVEGAHAHMGQTANSMAAILLSVYPSLGYREATVDMPRMPGTTLAELVRARGGRTAFLHSGDFDWANERAFLECRGYDRLADADLVAPEGTARSSWGVDDRHLFDAALRWLDEGPPDRPFLLTLWTDRTHHPYEPAPETSRVERFRKGSLRGKADEWSFARYLDILADADRGIGRLLESLRARGLENETLVVVTGDHGETFGFPHETWGHGFATWRENLEVPLVLLGPGVMDVAPSLGATRDPEGGLRLATVAGHVDLAPTVADLLGLARAPSWQGWSLLDPRREPRVYLLAAASDYLFAIREGRWKYVLDLSHGADALYDLDADPEEARDVAPAERVRAAELRRKLGVFMHFQSRHLAGLAGGAAPGLPR